MAVKNIFRVLLFSLVATLAQAHDSERHIRADGMEVYLGVVPAQMMNHHPDKQAGHAHGAHEYHVLVALFDSSTGMRITDAQVKARVGQKGKEGESKKLEPLHEGKVQSFSNFFTMDEPGRYQIDVVIHHKPGMPGIEAGFVFKRPED